MKYPKFLLLILTIVLAYFIFESKNISGFYNFLTSLGYFGTFIAGIFYAYGFSAAPATSILLILSKTQNIILSGLIAGGGALVGDLLIFKFIRSSFQDEINKLKKEKFIVYLDKKLSFNVKRWALISIAIFIIAAPLPDEIGVSMLAAYDHISTRIFSILSYFLNTGGIFVILYLGKII